MDEDKIIEILENCEIPEKKIIEVVSQIKKNRKQADPKTFALVDDIKVRLNEEENPFERSALMARASNTATPRLT